MNPKTEKRDWKKVVAESNGSSFFLPDSFKAAADAIEEKRKAFNEIIKTVASKEIELNMATQNMFYDFRKYLADSGNGDVWVKEVGFDVNALQEGIYIVNLREQQR